MESYSLKNVFVPRKQPCIIKGRWFSLNLKGNPIGIGNTGEGLSECLCIIYIPGILMKGPE